MPAQCGFSYRGSAFKQQPERYIVLAVSFALRAHGAPTLRYAELSQALAQQTQPPSLTQVRATVLALRRAKSMVIDPSDENRRSAGSFFTNPVLSAARAEEVTERALQHKIVTRAEDVPRYPQSDGRMKLAAGWLIERAGIQKGLRHGHFGVSSRHALALVHHGGGKSAELLALARMVVRRVREVFGVELAAEPVFLGFDADPMSEPAANGR
jgi:UDP-N-acetylmuramate dehydrogenase